MSKLITSPPTWLFALEPARAVAELASLVPAKLTLSSPRGDGHAVMVLPGFMTGDITTLMLRRHLHHLGYRVRRWKLGLNLGPHAKPDLEDRLGERLEQVYRYTGQKVSLVGWSLGGLYARELARRYPEYVRQVITLGSPLLEHLNDMESIKIWRLYDLARGTDHEEQSLIQFIEQIAEPVPHVPVTAIYSRSDGIVPAEKAQVKPLPMKENIEVIGSHIGLVMNPLVNHVVADRLAQSEHHWQPFKIKGWQKWVFR